MDQNQIETWDNSSETNPDGDFGQQHIALLPLNDMFWRVRSTVEEGIKGWAPKETETAIYLHDALLSLRHWSDDIKNEEGIVLTEVEEHHAVLTLIIRRCLNDISSDLSNFRPIHEDGLSE